MPAQVSARSGANCRPRVPLCSCSIRSSRRRCATVTQIAAGVRCTADDLPSTWRESAPGPMAFRRPIDALVPERSMIDAGLVTVLLQCSVLQISTSFASRSVGRGLHPVLPSAAAQFCGHRALDASCCSAGMSVHVSSRYHRFRDRNTSGARVCSSRFQMRHSESELNTGKVYCQQGPIRSD